MIELRGITWDHVVDPLVGAAVAEGVGA